MITTQTRTPLRRRRITLVVGAIALVTTLVACSRTTAPGTPPPDESGATNIVAIDDALVAAAESEGTVTVQYSMPLESMDGIVAEFNKDYPDIRVVAVRNAGSAGGQKLLQDVRAGVQDIDVIEGSDMDLNNQLIQAASVLPLSPENQDAFPPTYSIQPGMWTNVATTSVIAYNTNEITAEQAEILAEQGWQGILDPQFAGRFSMVTPTVGSTLTPLNFVLNDPDLGEDYLRDLAEQEPVIFDTTALARDALVAGSTPIAWMHAWDAISLQLISTGAPIAFLYANPSIQYPGSLWGVASNAPHPHAARLFWAWLLSEEGGCQASQLPFMNNQCVLEGVEDDRPAMAEARNADWYRAPSEDFASVTVLDAVANNAANAELWYEVFDYQP